MLLILMAAVQQPLHPMADMPLSVLKMAIWLQKFIRILLKLLIVAEPVQADPGIIN